MERSTLLSCLCRLFLILLSVGCLCPSFFVSICSHFPPVFLCVSSCYPCFSQSGRYCIKSSLTKPFSILPHSTRESYKFMLMMSVTWLYSDAADFTQIMATCNIYFTRGFLEEGKAWQILLKIWNIKLSSCYFITLICAETTDYELLFNMQIYCLSYQHKNAVITLQSEII